MIIVDSGPLFALADSDDRHHQACVEWLESTDEPLTIPPLVIAEVCYLIGRSPGAETEAGFIDSIGPLERFTLADLVNEDIRRMAQLVRQYADFPLGGTDASVIAIAERLGTDQVPRSTGGTSPQCVRGMCPRSGCTPKGSRQLEC